MVGDRIKPTQKLERIASLDFLRGIAILGILFINTENFAYSDPWSPWKFGFNGLLDHSTRFWVYFLTQGKFYTMFALLFGVGFYIFLERLEQRGLGIRAMDIYARRLLWLFVIGIIHSYFIWTGDVLYHYAICGLLLFPFRSIKNINLVLTIIFLLFLQLVKSHEQTVNRKESFAAYNQAKSIPENERTKEDTKKIELWKDRLIVKTADTSRVEIPKETYFSGLKETYRHASAHKGLLYYQSLLFSSLMVMILGILLYRSGIFSDYSVWKYYWLISLSVLSIGLIINYLRFYHWTYEYFDPVVNTWNGLLFTFPKELLGTGYILILNGVYQKFLKNGKLKLISNMGQMALSNYIFQNIILGFIFYGYGLAKFNEFSRFELLGVVLAIWIIQVLLSWFWIDRYKQGPLEWVWKALTYEAFYQKKP